jgi:hypothetical protein
VKNPALVAARAGRYHGAGVLQLSIDEHAPPGTATNGHELLFDHLIGAGE